MSGTIFTIAQQKGGVGKTTIAAHLAVAWADANRSVAVLDIDPQGSMGEWLEARERRLGEDNTGLSFRTASGWGARREAMSLARDHDVVVIDTPPHAERDTRPAMEASDLVIIPVQPTPVDVWATEPILDMARAAKSPVMLVLNRVPPRARLTEEMVAALQQFDARIAETRFGNRVAFAECLNTGRAVQETQPKSKSALEALALAAELLAVVETGKR